MNSAQATLRRRPSETRRPGETRRRGAMLVLVAFMMVVVFGVAVFAVDLSWIVTNRTQLQSAADAAALAGAGTLVTDVTLGAVEAEALHYANINAPQSAASVTFGTWAPDAQLFTPGNFSPTAVRVAVQRTAEQDNAVPSFLAKLFGHSHFDIVTEAIAVGAIPAVTTSTKTTSVYVTSTKDLSNVVLHFDDGTHQKFEGLTGYTGTFSGTGEHEGKVVVGVWIKSGSYLSGDGPGYGEYLADPGDGTTVHGRFENRGSRAHVTATFNAEGVTFTDSGSAGPVRLVK